MARCRVHWMRSAGLNQTRAAVVDYATRTIALVVQVGRRGGERGVVQVYMPELEAGSAES